MGTDALAFMGAAEALGTGAGEVVPGYGVADVVLAAGSEGSIADSFGLEVPKVEESTTHEAAKSEEEPPLSSSS